MARRRSNGEGTICRCKRDGKDAGWTAKLTMGVDAKGRTIRRSVYGRTQTEVKEKLEELRKQRDSGVVVKDARRTLGEWLTEWLENHVQPSSRPSTYQTYESAVRLFITPRIGAIPLHKLTAEHVDRMIAGMTRDSLSDRQRLKAYAALRRALNVATRRKLIGANPCGLVDAPKYQAPEAKALTVEQAKAILTASQGYRLGPVVSLAIASGLRLGELLGLQWGDIDFKRGTITVRRTQRETGGKFSYGDPKTKSGRRSVTLDPSTLGVLNRHRAAMLREGQEMAEEGFVFALASGRPIRRWLFYETTWKPILKAAEVKHLPFHSTRHTSATLMLAGGVHPKVAQSRLGHSRIGVTLDVYSHVMAGMDEGAAAVIGSALNPVQDTAEVG